MEFDPRVIRDYLDYLDPKKGLIIFGSSLYESDAVFDTIRLKEAISKKFGPNENKKFLNDADDAYGDMQVEW